MTERTKAGGTALQTDGGEFRDRRGSYGVYNTGGRRPSKITDIHAKFHSDKTVYEWLKSHFDKQTFNLMMTFVIIILLLVLVYMVWPLFR